MLQCAEEEIIAALMASSDINFPGGAIAIVWIQWRSDVR
jgi:hypothetical protein